MQDKEEEQKERAEKADRVISEYMKEHFPFLQGTSNTDQERSDKLSIIFSAFVVSRGTEKRR